MLALNSSESTYEAFGGVLKIPRIVQGTYLNHRKSRKTNQHTDTGTEDLLGTTQTKDPQPQKLPTVCECHQFKTQKTKEAVGDGGVRGEEEAVEVDEVAELEAIGEDKVRVAVGEGDVDGVEGVGEVEENAVVGPEEAVACRKGEAVAAASVGRQSWRRR
ncbi:hypothetical protein NL676_027587 [Syzygium grande]|nr:hypothetical protein NL676_027587 [Syzygium grande]